MLIFLRFPCRNSKNYDSLPPTIVKMSQKGTVINQLIGFQNFSDVSESVLFSLEDFRL